MTKVPSKAAWEYCIYVEDNDYGIYKQDGSKVSRPFGMSVEKTLGPAGIVKVKIAKSLIKKPQAVRFTISTFDPDQLNSVTSYQGISSASDVFPGTKETFGGEINGYGEITSSLLSAIKEYTIYYVYDGINPIAEYSPNGSILARYVYVGGLHIAKIAGADTNWYHCDALGSPRTMTNEIGAVTWTANYYPFGEMTAGPNNTHGFTGKEYDSEMGLNYFCQRYYDPEIGRFITLDPFGGYTTRPETQNRYAYCINNPLKYIDALGLDMQPYVPDPDEDDEWWWPIGIIIPVVGITVWGNPDPFYSDDPYDVFYGEDPSGQNYTGGTLGGGYGGSSGSNRSGGGNGDYMPWVPGHPFLGQIPMPNAVGWQWQAGYTLYEGIATGLNQMWGPDAQGLYSFGEVNRGGACGANIGFVLAWGSGSWAGQFADMSVSYGFLSFSYFESGSWQGVYFGFGLGPPVPQITGGYGCYFKR